MEASWAASRLCPRPSGEAVERRRAGLRSGSRSSPRSHTLTALLRCCRWMKRWLFADSSTGKYRRGHTKNPLKSGRLRDATLRFLNPLRGAACAGPALG